MMLLNTGAAFVILAVALSVVLADPALGWTSKKRRLAEEKGYALLEAWFTPEQAMQWKAAREFDVIGSQTGARYRIKNRAAMNVHQLDPEGRTLAQWCFAPEGKLAVGDVLLAQKIALETMEREALDLANSQSYRQ
jgi:hypothetical protein